jgi:phosphoglycolate phosphatase-like HAD superfamily hydrolase
MQAARAAGCVAVGALYGYLHPEDPPNRWDADLMIEQPGQLIDRLHDEAIA